MPLLLFPYRLSASRDDDVVDDHRRPAPCVHHTNRGAQNIEGHTTLIHLLLTCRRRIVCSLSRWLQPPPVRSTNRRAGPWYPAQQPLPLPVCPWHAPAAWWHMDRAATAVHAATLLIAAAVRVATCLAAIAVRAARWCTASAANAATAYEQSDTAPGERIEMARRAQRRGRAVTCQRGSPS